MLDLVQEIQDYPPHHQPNKGNFNQPPSQIAKAPLIDQYNQPNLAHSKVQQTQTNTGCTRFFKLEFYQSFFKVSQAQVLERIKSAVIPPFKQDFLELTIKDNPDFYGPFWIQTTIFFLLAFVANLSNYINYKIDGINPPQGYFDLSQFRYAFIVAYSFGLGAPFILYFVLKFMGNELKLQDLICIYGYSLACFIPALILCIMPLSILHWILLLYAFANSTLFMITSINKYIEGIKAKNITVFCIIGGIQLILFLLSKLYFISLK